MERFIVGTGRCGSTLLSTMLSKHPDGLVLSEFFGGVHRPSCFPEAPLSGAALVAALNRGNIIADFMRANAVESKEQLYDFSQGEAAPDQAVFSPILYVCLPFLSEEPDQLLDEIFAFLGGRAVQPAHDHYVALFKWLQRRAGKTFWLERSGTSWEFFPALRRTFPDAKYVHIHRDGHEAALSMHAYPFLQITTSIFTRRPDREEIADMARNWADRTDANPFRRRLHDLPAIGTFGDYWSWQVAEGFSALPQLNRDQYLDVRFEDLRQQPHATLALIAEFFELPAAPGWIDEAVKLLSNDVGNRFTMLSATDQAALRRACLPGNVLLGRAEPQFIQDVLDDAMSLREAVE